jgi:hypothetical protein
MIIQKLPLLVLFHGIIIQKYGVNRPLERKGLNALYLLKVFLWGRGSKTSLYSCENDKEDE